jgi:hypothetical protein
MNAGLPTKRWLRAGGFFLPLFDPEKPLKNALFFGLCQEYILDKKGGDPVFFLILRGFLQKNFMHTVDCGNFTSYDINAV